MRNTVLSYLLLPLFAGLSLSASATTNLVSDQPIAAVASLQSHAARLNLNKADATALQKELNGIGQAKAEAIVAYREANGPYTSVDELLEIKGIGNALLERNRDKLTVD